MKPYPIKNIDKMTKIHAIRPREPNSRLYEVVLLIAFFFSGATSLSLEVAWSKELTYLLGVDIYATTTVVTAFMAGLGLGALLVARSDRWIQASVKTYGLLQLVIGSCALLSIPLFRATSPLFSFLFNSLGYDSAGFLLIRFLGIRIHADSGHADGNDTACGRRRLLPKCERPLCVSGR